MRTTSRAWETRTLWTLRAKLCFDCTPTLSFPAGNDIPSHRAVPVWAQTPLPAGAPHRPAHAPGPERAEHAKDSAGRSRRSDLVQTQQTPSLDRRSDTVIFRHRTHIPILPPLHSLAAESAPVCACPHPRILLPDPRPIKNMLGLLLAAPITHHHTLTSPPP